MVSHDTRALMLVLITWGKELHLSHKRFIAVYDSCIQIYDSKSDKFKSMFMRVRQYKRFIAWIFDKLFHYKSIKQRFNEEKSCRKYTSKRIFQSSVSPSKH